MDDEWGITDGYFDVDGGWHVTPDESRVAIRAAMGEPVEGPPIWFVLHGSVHPLQASCRIVLEDGTDAGEHTLLPDDLPIGYHDLIPSDGGPTARLVVHPATCPPIPSEWGIAAQLYALWSDESWGIGDLRDLAVVARHLVDAGGSTILVSPLHQAAPSQSQQDSPYYPSSRRTWNPLLIAIDAPPPDDLVCRADQLIDRDAAWTAKRAALDAMFDAAGRPVTATSTVAAWNALCERFGATWQTWPDDIRSHDPAAIAARFAEDPSLTDLAAFHEWCQTLVADQLAVIADAGASVIGDLAVGFGPDGADAWEFQDLLALTMRVGAPPDTFNTAGQDWGIPPFVPWKVRNAWYEPYIETIRATLRGVHGLRIDHVMGLFRQYWVHDTDDGKSGAYVTFPSAELLAILCIEATRAGAFVVGEDLGTVAPGVREALAACNIAGTMVLWFEEEPPDTWPMNVLATVTTHDLPTIVGVLDGTDGDEDHVDRLRAVSDAQSPDEIVADTHRALLASPARLRLLSLDDACLAARRPNYPGTVDQPNWRRRLPLPVDRIAFTPTD